MDGTVAKAHAAHHYTWHNQEEFPPLPKASKQTAGTTSEQPEPPPSKPTASLAAQWERGQAVAEKLRLGPKADPSKESALHRNGPKRPSATPTKTGQALGSADWKYTNGGFYPRR